MEISVISLIGFVMLTGIIVNNGIVLVDYINQLRLEGMGRREAIIEAGKTRIRPILMTSITTILGLIDMALSKNAGSAMMQPMAIVCIGGLIYATLMTLLVVPCMYDILSRRDLRKVDEEELKKRIASNDGLKEQVFDLIVDAEKGSKKRVLEEEKVMEADLIICSLLYKENDIYEKKMEEMAKMRVEKLKELGLSN